MFIYNTKTRSKELLQLSSKKIDIYVCGVTVYDYCHLGHARTYVAFDSIIRYLQYKGYVVNYVRNITDIDDKIINRAHELNMSWDAVATKFTNEMEQDFAALNLLKPNVSPKATDYIPEMINLIEKLINKGIAYIISNGDVYFDLSQFNNYGQLSKGYINTENVVSRLDNAVIEKRNYNDFVLWKMAKPYEPSWQSPWGAGRPGWHIECSAMSLELLGENFTIHGGGLDLICPHHENECAQTESVTNVPLASYWMHTGFLQINNEKMSKSLNNFTTIRSTLNNTNQEVLRFFFLSAHYRSQLDFSEKNLANAKNSLDKIYLSIRDLELPEVCVVQNDQFLDKFVNAMDDDFNTVLAISVLFELVTNINKTEHVAEKTKLAIQLCSLARVLGLLQLSADDYFKNIKHGITEEEILKLIDERNVARFARNFSRSDEIRNQLKDNNVLIEDTADGTKWRYM